MIRNDAHLAMYSLSHMFLLLGQVLFLCHCLRVLKCQGGNNNLSLLPSIFIYSLLQEGHILFCLFC